MPPKRVGCPICQKQILQSDIAAHAARCGDARGQHLARHSSRTKKHKSGGGGEAVDHEDSEYRQQTRKSSRRVIPVVPYTYTPSTPTKSPKKKKRKAIKGSSNTVDNAPPEITHKPKGTNASQSGEPANKRYRKNYPPDVQVDQIDEFIFYQSAVNFETYNGEKFESPFISSNLSTGKSTQKQAGVVTQKQAGVVTNVPPPAQPKLQSSKGFVEKPSNLDFPALEQGCIHAKSHGNSVASNKNSAGIKNEPKRIVEQTVESSRLGLVSNHANPADDGHHSEKPDRGKINQHSRAVYTSGSNHEPPVSQQSVTVSRSVCDKSGGRNDVTVLPTSQQKAFPYAFPSQETFTSNFASNNYNSSAVMYSQPSQEYPVYHRQELVYRMPMYSQTMPQYMQLNLRHTAPQASMQQPVSKHPLSSEVRQIPSLVCIPLPVATMESDELAINSPPGGIRCVGIGDDSFKECRFKYVSERCTNRTAKEYCQWHDPQGYMATKDAKLLRLQYKCQEFVRLHAVHARQRQIAENQ